MDASRKRKAANAPGTPSSEGASAWKKIKLLNSNHAPAPKSNVQELGQRLVNQLRTSKDKNGGRLIATQFLTLPPRDELPDYYKFTKLPVALDTIESRLKRNAYPTMTAVESDFKRMVQNAKDYNDPKSEIYEDAERIRKLVFNYMKLNNPEYTTNPGYTSFATRIPQTNGANGVHVVAKAERDPEPRESEDPRNSAAPSTKASQPPSDRKASVAPSAATGDEDAGYEGGGGGGDVLDFIGMSFQQAQQKIISYLLHYTDEEGLELYTPFGNLPTRKLEDYYQVIKHPVSLKGVAKRCRGQHGRNPPTGVSDFKTWEQFEEEISFIWRNAQDYNEEGSDMYTLANEFKAHFQSLVQDAKDKVEEPSGPRIKLGGPKPKVTLNLSQHRNSPAPAGVHVDNEALARQKQMVAAGVNGQQQARPPQTNGLARSSSHVPTIEPRPQSGGQAGSPPGTAVKTEKPPTPAMSNTLPATQPQTNGMMPPPLMRPPSGSPYPLQPLTSSYTYTSPNALPPLALRPYPAEQALLPTVTLQTHPHLPIAKPFSIAIPPHSSLSQQSTTLTLPNSHYFIQICPTISKQLSMGRPYKLFVTLNGVRLNQRDTRFLADSGRRTHVYEGSLMLGVNRVEVEVAAGRGEVEKEGGREKERKEGLDVEKVTVYANLMRA